MPRRRFIREFKLSTMRLIQSQVSSIGEAAQSLDVDPATIRNWLVEFPTTGEAGTAATDSALREENKRFLQKRENFE